MSDIVVGTVEAPVPTRVAFVKERLIVLNRQASNLILETGTLLKEYQDGSYYRIDGYESFDSAINALQQSGQVDFGSRNARNMIAIVEMVTSLGLPADQIEGIGISKLRELASLRDPEEQKRLIGAAGDMSVAEVQKEAKRLRDRAAGRETDPLEPKTLMLTQTQREFYEHCIKQARETYAIEDVVTDTYVLVDAILADWCSGIDSAPKEEVM